jgi:poly-gamma-glutamate synthesis protein (capsule biosynthesis protein)
MVQKAMAKEFVNMGIDVVFGDHPHVIEPYEYIKTENGNEGHIFYSLGNFISDQRKMPSAAAYCEDGVMTTVEFSLDQNTNKAFVSDIDYIPTWVNKVGTAFHILPAQPSLEQKNAFGNDVLACLARSKSNTDAVLNTVAEANAIIKGVK